MSNDDFWDKWMARATIAACVLGISAGIAVDKYDRMIPCLMAICISLLLLQRISRSGDRTNISNEQSGSLNQ